MFRFYLLAVVLVSATIALAQSPASTEAATVTGNSWQLAQAAGSNGHKLFVVTFDQPTRRQTCHVQSFTVDKLVCSQAIGRTRTYLPQQVLALILPGDRGLKLRLLLGLNSGLAAAIWGTVVLAATCPACAAATAVAALLVFCAAGAIAMGDEQPERLLYLAAGQHLKGKLRFIRPYDL